jgi:hypothetical protein
MIFHARATRPTRHRDFKPVLGGTATLATASFLLAACTTVPQPVKGVAKVNPASIAAAPATWDGREVEIVGLVIWESGMAGLYQSYGAYCRGAEGAAINVPWDRWPGVSPKDSRRRAIVRGVFRNRVALPQTDGSTTISAGAGPGPGPLEPGIIVSWLSNPERPCRNRQ